MRNKNGIVVATILVVLILLVALLASEGKNQEQVNNEQMEIMIKDIDEILSGEEKNIDKANEILKLFADEKNNGDLNSHELNLVINKYESNIIEAMLDADHNRLGEYNNSLKFINTLRMITGYKLKPWQTIEAISMNNQSIEVVTNTKDYEIKGEDFYFSMIENGEISEYFDFDAWLNLLSDVLSKEYPKKYPNSENILNGFKIIVEWTSEEFVIHTLNVSFLAITYSKVQDNVTVDGMTIFTMLINEENDVINLEGIYKFGEKYSVSEGVDYLNKAYGNAKGNDLQVIDDWLDETVNNPLNGEEQLNRDQALTAIRSSVKSWML